LGEKAFFLTNERFLQQLIKVKVTTVVIVVVVVVVVLVVVLVVAALLPATTASLTLARMNTDGRF